MTGRAAARNDDGVRQRRATFEVDRHDVFRLVVVEGSKDAGEERLLLGRGSLRCALLGSLAGQVRILLCGRAGKPSSEPEWPPRPLRDVSSYHNACVSTKTLWRMAVEALRIAPPTHDHEGRRWVGGAMRRARRPSARAVLVKTRRVMIG